MIAFRQNGPWKDCLIYGNIRPKKSGSEVIAYQRYTEDVLLEGYFNFSGGAVREKLSENGAKAVWGNKMTAEITEDTLLLEPYEAVLVVYEK